MLTMKDRRSFDELGYFTLEGELTPSELCTLDDAISPHLLGLGTEATVQNDDYTSVKFVAERDDTIRSYALRPSLVSLAIDLLGPDIDLHWNQAVVKLPHRDIEFPWHQDEALRPVEPSPMLNVWIAMTDSTPESGCLFVIPGSHRQGVVPHSGNVRGLRTHRPEESEAVPLPLRAGGAVVFSSLTLHKSGSNRTMRPSKDFFLQYSKAGLKDLKTGQTFRDRIAAARNGSPATA